MTKKSSIHSIRTTASACFTKILLVAQIVCISFIAFHGSNAKAEEEHFFVFTKTCAKGTAIGGLLGVLSVALSDRPDDHKINIARGAALGLYAGIIYGLVRLNENPDNQEARYNTLITPLVVENHIEGLSIQTILIDF